METALEVLLEDGVIDEVLGRLKSGKEANISLVRRGDVVMAAKVYKDVAIRSFKNNADYKEGRKVRNSRSQRAMDSGSKFGRDAAEQAWKSAEADAMFKLVGSGVRIPMPIMFYEGVLLMDLVRDAEDRPAPRLIDVAITKEAAVGLYADLVAQIISMLCCDLIHGDLSPYNILAAAAGPTIIDFPQVISAVHSSRAEYFFLRDFDNIVAFVSGFDPSLAVHTADGRAIWRAYVSRDLTPEYVPPPPPPPRATRGPDRRSRPDDRSRPPPQQRRDGRGSPPPRFEHNRPQQQRSTQQTGGTPQVRADSRDPAHDVSTEQARPQDDYRADPPRPPPLATPPRDDSRGAPNGAPPSAPQPGRWDGRGPYQARPVSPAPQQNGGSHQGRSDTRGPQQSRGPQQNRGPSQGRNDSRGPQQGAGSQQPRRDPRAPRGYDGRGAQQQPDPRWPQPFDRQPQQPDTRPPQAPSAPRPPQLSRAAPPPRSEPRSYSSAPAPRADGARPGNGPRKRRPRRRG